MKAVVAAFNHDYEPSDGTFSSTSGAPVARALLSRGTQRCVKLELSVAGCRLLEIGKTIQP